MKLGQQVQCNGYLKKLTKKYCIPYHLSQPDKHTLEIMAYGDPIYLKECDYVFQDNYKVIDCKKFKGIVVGKKRVTLKTLYYDDYNECTGQHFVRTENHSEDVIECYKVYYSFGKSRLIPTNMVKALEVKNEL